MTLAKKYADLADKEDLSYLVSFLPGGISEISRRCKLTRRTLYRLQQEENIRQETKTKVLEACLETNPSQTLRYLLRRSKDKSASILLTYLSSIYQSAVTAKIPQAFKTGLDSFIEARREHFGLISDEIEDEVSSMLRFLDEKASELTVDLPVDTLQTTRCSHLLEIIPRVIQDIRVGRIAEDLSKTYNVPVELTRVLSDSLVPLSRLEETVKIQDRFRTSGTITRPAEEITVSPMHTLPLEIGRGMTTIGTAP